MHIGTDYGRIGHHPRHVRLAGKRCEHPVEHAHLDPAIMAVLHRLMTARPLRQIAPPAAGPGLLQQRVGAGGLSRSHGASRGESTSLSKADLQKSVLNHESLSRGIPNREIVTTI